MNLVAQDPRQAIDICGFTVAPRSCVIHFYYSRTERQRFCGFLLDGITADDAVVLAATPEGLAVLCDGLRRLGLLPSDASLLKIPISVDLPASITRIAAAVRQQLNGKCKRARLLVDFEQTPDPETIFELEGLLASALSTVDVVCVSQYDGRGFTAPITIEQFRTHALALVGNVLYQENKNYTSPETYYKARAVGKS